MLGEVFNQEELREEQLSYFQDTQTSYKHLEFQKA
jgi:hypothetical protein